MTSGPMTLSPRSSPLAQDSPTPRPNCTLWDAPCHPAYHSRRPVIPGHLATLPWSSTLHPPVKIDISLHLGVTFEPTVIIDHLGAYTFPPSPLISLSQATDFFFPPKQMVRVSCALSSHASLAPSLANIDGESFDCWHAPSERCSRRARCRCRCRCHHGCASLCHTTHR